MSFQRQEIRSLPLTPLHPPPLPLFFLCVIVVFLFSPPTYLPFPFPFFCVTPPPTFGSSSPPLLLPSFPFSTHKPKVAKPRNRGRGVSPFTFSRCRHVKGEILSHFPFPFSHFLLPLLFLLLRCLRLRFAFDSFASFSARIRLYEWLSFFFPTSLFRLPLSPTLCVFFVLIPCFLPPLFFLLSTYTAFGRRVSAPIPSHCPWLPKVYHAKSPSRASERERNNKQKRFLCLLCVCVRARKKRRSDKEMDNFLTFYITTHTICFFKQPNTKRLKNSGCVFSHSQAIRSAHLFVCVFFFFFLPPPFVAVPPLSLLLILSCLKLSARSTSFSSSMSMVTSDAITCSS